VPLFRRSPDDPPDGGASPPESESGSDQFAIAPEQFARMSLAQRAAAVLEQVMPGSVNKITVVRYMPSPDGLAALKRGDVAEVVARRLLD
jgi:hypothetical protein